MKIKIWLILVLVFAVACNTQIENSPSCSPPSIMVAGECCIDKNNNSVCDDIEAKHSDGKALAVKDNIDSKEQKLKSHVSFGELKIGINKTFYPIGSYNFSFVERENITGLEAIFDVWDSAPFRFSILKIKKEYNFLETEKNFSDFVNKRYELEVRNTNTSSQEYIDSERSYNEKWERAKYNYTFTLEKIDLNGDPAYFEMHQDYFSIDEQLQDLSTSFKIVVQCTPDLVIETYASETFNVPYFPGSLVSTNKERVGDAIKKEIANMTIAAGKISTLCRTGNLDPIEFKPNEIIFRGMGGLYPSEIKIKAGDKVIIHNFNDRLLGTAFTFIREKPARKVFNSKGIPLNSVAEVVIDEAGNYIVFAPEYAGNAKIIVE